jgi:hypothetical protein
LPEYVEFQGKEIKTQKVRVAPEQYGQPYSLYGQTITVTNPTTNDEYRYNFFKGWEKVQTEAIKEDVSKTINYVQFRLSKESRQELMNVYPGVYSKQLLKHITLAYDVDPTKFEQYKKKWNDESFIATGIINGNGVDMFTVTCGNKNIRPDGNYYHITASVEPPIKPEESKVFIKQRRGHPHTKIKPISLTGEIVLSTIKSKLTEDAQQPKVYVDMDGVIADFKTQFAKYDYDISKLANTDPKTIKSLFANLKPLYDGVKLLQWLTRNKVDFTILSAPLRPGSKTDDSGSNASKIGKHEWLSKNVPGKEKTAIFTSNKHKYANNSILIDDSSRYIDKWTEAGGIGILHTDYESTISKLEKILNKQNTLP